MVSYNVQYQYKKEIINGTPILFIKFLDFGEYTSLTGGLVLYNHLENLYSRLKKYYGYEVAGNIYIIHNPNFDYPDSKGEFVPDKVKGILPVDFHPTDNNWIGRQSIRL